ncbi:hypothetical protein GCM10009865_25950 [Aeromicrobium ponti]
MSIEAVKNYKQRTILKAENVGYVHRKSFIRREKRGNVPINEEIRGWLALKKTKVINFSL